MPSTGVWAAVLVALTLATPAQARNIAGIVKKAVAGVVNPAEALTRELINTNIDDMESAVVEVIETMNETVTRVVQQNNQAQLKAAEEAAAANFETARNAIAVENVNKAKETYTTQGARPRRGCESANLAGAMAESEKVEDILFRRITLQVVEHNQNNPESLGARKSREALFRTDEVKERSLSDFYNPPGGTLSIKETALAGRVIANVTNPEPPPRVPEKFKDTAKGKRYVDRVRIRNAWIETAQKALIADTNDSVGSISKDDAAGYFRTTVANLDDYLRESGETQNVVDGMISKKALVREIVKSYAFEPTFMAEINQENNLIGVVRNQAAMQAIGLYIQHETLEVLRDIRRAQALLLSRAAQDMDAEISKLRSATTQ